MLSQQLCDKHFFERNISSTLVVNFEDITKCGEGAGTPQVTPRGYVPMSPSLTPLAITYIKNKKRSLLR